MNTSVGAVSFKAVIDTSGIKSEIAKLNNALARERVAIKVALDTSTLKGELGKIANAVTRERANVKVGLQVDNAALKGLQGQLKAARAETIKITPQVDQKPIQQLGQSLRGVQGDSRSLSSTLDNFGNNLIARFFAFETAIAAVQGAVGALVGSFGKASESFREFEENFLNFEVRSQGVDVDVDALKDEVSRVAKETSQSPVSLSAAVALAPSIGIAPEEVSGRLESTARLSDLIKEEPSEILKTTQAALVAYESYGVGIDEVNDLVFQSFATTKLGADRGLREFEQLFSKAAAPAAALGVELEELLTAGATLRASGALPETAATAIELLIQRIATRRDELQKEGVEIEFKENGGLDIEGTLLNINGRIKDLSEIDQIDFLTGVFGEKTASDLVVALKTIDTTYAQNAESIGQYNGAIGRGFDILKAGTNFQAGLVEGVVEDTFNQIGEAINPIEQGFISLQQQVAEASNITLAPLTESAERLGLVLSENPELVEALAEAFSRIGNTAVEQLAALADAITVLVSDEAAIATYADGIELLIVAFGRLASGTVGLLGIVDDLFQQREFLPGVESSAFSLLTAITNPLSLVQVAIDAIGGVLDTVGEKVSAFAGRFQGLADAVIDAIPGLRQAIEALQLLRGEQEKPESVQPGIGGGIAGGLIRSFDGINNLAKTANNLARDASGDKPGFDPPEDGLSAGEQLKEFRREQDILLNEIAAAESEAQITLTQEGADPSAFIEQERKTLEARVKARQDFVDDLKQLKERPGISVADTVALEKAIAEAEQQLSADRLSVAQNFQKSRAEVLRLASQEQQQALADIEREASAVAASIAEQNLGPRDAAAAQAASEQDGLRARLENRRVFLAELQKLEAEGGLTAEQAVDIGNQIVQAETDINNDRAALATSLEQERQRVLQQSLDDQLAALQIFRDREAQVLESRKTDLEGQLSIIAADNQVTVAGDSAAAADLGLERERLDTIRQQALAVNDLATARQADRDIAALTQLGLEQQAAAQQRQFAVKRQQLTIELQIARIEAQRQALIANIAVKEAELNIQKAIGSKASQEEVDNLRQVLALRQDIADDAAKGIQVTEQVFASRFEEIGIEEQISQTEQLQAVEDQRQENLGKAKEIVDQEIEAKQRLISAEKALVDAERARAGALISALNAQRATTEEAQEQLKLIRERFREAQGAGLFSGLGGEFERAASQLQGILANGGKLKDLVDFAKGTDDAIARQLLSGVGRGDVVSLLDAEEQSEQVANAQAEAQAARAAADQILIDEIANAGEPLLIAFREGGAEAAGLIRQALAFVAPPGAAQSLRVGGVVDGAPGGMAPVQLHRDEFTFAPVGTRVVSQAESRRLVQQHLAATMPNLGPMVAPTLSIPDFGGAATRAAMDRSMPTAAQLNAKGLERRFDELIAIVERGATRADGGQFNHFELSDRGEAARLAADLRKLGRRAAGRLF